MRKHGNMKILDGFYILAKFYCSNYKLINSLDYMGGSLGSFKHLIDDLFGSVEI